MQLSARSCWAVAGGTQVPQANGRAVNASAVVDCCMPSVYVSTQVVGGSRLLAHDRERVHSLGAPG